MKKKIAVLLCFVMIGMNIMPFASYAADFSDLSTEHWAYEYIDALSSAGVINGYPDGTFQPNGSITRAEFFKLMSIIQADDTAVEEYEGEMTHWYDPYVEYIFSRGMEMEGTTRENMDMPITRKEATIVLAGFAVVNVFTLDFDFDTNKVCDKFKDLEGFSETENYLLNYACYCQMINGYEDGTFRPNNTITRAEAATILMRFCNAWEYAYNESLKLSGGGK